MIERTCSSDTKIAVCSGTMKEEASVPLPKKDRKYASPMEPKRMSRRSVFVGFTICSPSCIVTVGGTYVALDDESSVVFEGISSPESSLSDSRMCLAGGASRLVGSKSMME